MSNEISILLALRSAEATVQLNKFLSEASHGLKRFAEEAVAAFLGFEGLRKIFDLEKDALKLEESIGKLSQISGLSVSTLVAMRTAATEAGIPFDNLRTSLGKFAQMVYEAAANGGKAADAFRTMGIALTNTDGTLRDTDAIFKEFLVKFKDMPNGPQKTAFAMEVMGRSAREAIPMLNAASRAMEETNSTSPISDTSVVAATEFNRTIRETSEAVENLFITLANSLLPTLTRVADKLKELVTEAQGSNTIITGLVAVFKGLVTVVAIAGLAFYDLGKFIGEDVNLLIDNFNVAIETCKNLLKDLAQFLVDDARLVLDFVKSIFAASEVKDALLSGHFGTARDIIKDQFEAIKADVLKISGDIGNSVSDIFAGVAKGTGNVFNMATSYSLDLLQEWNQLGGFLKDLWNGPGMKAAEASGDKSPIHIVSSDSLKNLSTLQSILASIYKQEVDLINDDPFKTQVEKVNELIPLLEKQKDIILQEYAAAKAQLDNPANSETQKLAIIKDLVKLQGELNGLKKQEASMDLSLGAQMRKTVVELANDWGSLAKQITATFKGTINGAINTISSNLTGLIMQTKTWAQALTNIGTSILTMIIEGIIKMGLQWVATQLMMLISGKAMAAAGVAANAGVAAAQSAIWATPATLAAIASYGAAAEMAPGLIAIAEASTLAESMFRERGGPVSAGQPYIVGEKRPELFVPDQSGFILPEVPSAAASGAGSGSSTPVNLHFHGGESDAMKAMRSTEGQNYIIDLNRKNVKRISRV